MLEALISSKTRIKLLLRLFLNPGSKAYLRGLAEEFHESTNSVRLELNRFEEAGLLSSDLEGNKKFFHANEEYPLYKEIRKILLKYTGLQNVIDEVIKEVGEINEVYLSGELAQGKQSGVISLLIVGKPDKHYLTNLITKVEETISKKIQYLIYSKEESSQLELNSSKYLMIWHD